MIAIFLYIIENRYPPLSANNNCPEEQTFYETEANLYSQNISEKNHSL